MHARPEPEERIARIKMMQIYSLTKRRDDVVLVEMKQIVVVGPEIKRSLRVCSFHA